jgi:hypothetical protein
MDQGLGRPTLRIARPKGSKRAEMQGCFEVIVPYIMIGRLEEVDQPRLIYFNGLYNKGAFSCSGFRHVIAFYTSATGTLRGNSSFKVWIIGIFQSRL